MPSPIKLFLQSLFFGGSISKDPTTIRKDHLLSALRGNLPCVKDLGIKYLESLVKDDPKATIAVAFNRENYYINVKVALHAARENKVKFEIDDKTDKPFLSAVPMTQIRELINPFEAGDTFTVLFNNEPHQIPIDHAINLFKQGDVCLDLKRQCLKAVGGSTLDKTLGTDVPEQMSLTRQPSRFEVGRIDK